MRKKQKPLIKTLKIKSRGGKSKGCHPWWALLPNPESGKKHYSRPRKKDSWLWKKE